MRIFVTVFYLLFMTALCFGQVWVYDSDFAVAPQPHDVEVGTDGKIWIGYYGRSDTVEVGDTTMSVNALRCYNPDGTQAAFSPIWIFTDGATFTDTMDYDNNPYSCRGLGVDPDGNIVWSSSDGKMWVIDYQTGEGLKRITYDPAGSLTEAAFDDNGFMYVGRVVGGQPAKVYFDYEPYAVIADVVTGLQRSIEVSGDGTTLYFGKIYTGPNQGVDVWYSADGPDGVYAKIDSVGSFTGDGDVFHAMWGQCLDMDPSGLLWVGTYWDVSSYDFTGWYALDPMQNYAIVDTVGHNHHIPKVTNTEDWITPPPGGTYLAPRNAAWSADGKTMYTADFDGGVVKKWTNDNPKKVGDTPLDPETVVSIEYDNMGRATIAVEFDLKQNYPNPFNPTTTIPVDLAKPFHVKLNIYDVSGRLVKTLVDDQLSAGRHEFKFDGSDLSSGTYIYNMIVNGNSLTKRMLLIK